MFLAVILHSLAWASGGPVGLHDFVGAKVFSVTIFYFREYEEAESLLAAQVKRRRIFHIVLN